MTKFSDDNCKNFSSTFFLVQDQCYDFGENSVMGRCDDGKEATVKFYPSNNCSGEMNPYRVPPQRTCGPDFLGSGSFEETIKEGVSARYECCCDVDLDF